jgi:hypothetical protein
VGTKAAAAAANASLRIMGQLRSNDVCEYEPKEARGDGGEENQSQKVHRPGASDSDAGHPPRLSSRRAAQRTHPAVIPESRAADSSGNCVLGGERLLVSEDRVGCDEDPPGEGDEGEFGWFLGVSEAPIDGLEAAVGPAC